MDAAAGMLGRDVEVLQRLKSMGCPAFRGSRVHVEELRTYIEANDAAVEAIEREIASSDKLDAEIKRRKVLVQEEQLRRLRFENDLEEGKFIPKDEAVRIVSELAFSQKEILRRFLEDEGPDRLVMKTREEVVAICRVIVDSICAEMCRCPLGRADLATPHTRA